jgi:putative ATP-dependent endonuclease of OLD family
MIIESVHIKNFRSFKDDIINFDDYTCLVGANGAGKSTVFTALQVFFRHFKDSKTDLSKLSEKDFHHCNIDEPIQITVTFSDLSAQATEDLKDYVRQGKLIVTAEAVYDKGTQRAEIKQYGNRLGMDDFRVFFDLDKTSAKAPELNACYNTIQGKYPNLPNAGSKDAKITALREYEATRPEECVLIPSEDQFYGASKGANRLAPHIQWVFVSASKDVTEEGDENKNSALGILLSRTVRAKVNFTERIFEIKQKVELEYSQLLSDEQAVLDDISHSLKSKLSQWAHPSINASVNWKQDADKAVKIEEPSAAIALGERGFEGELSRFGHGLQRSFMLALLQELSTTDAENAPTLILCIEEPELYQHPPQARHLAETLMELADDNTQVLVCSHSPLFVPKNNFEKIRIIRENGNPVESLNSCISYKELSEYLVSVGSKPVNNKGIVAKLFPYLSPSINEMFFCKTPVFVEGIEDVAYIKTYLELMGLTNDFRKFGMHLINADKKSNIIEPLAVASLLNINAYVVYDSDTDVEEKYHHQHKPDNKKLLTIQGYHTEDEFQPVNIIYPNLWAWKSNLGKEVQIEISNWSRYFDIACAEFGNAGGFQKNPMVIARTLELAWVAEEKSPALIHLVQNIIQYGNSINN